MPPLWGAQATPAQSGPAEVAPAQAAASPAAPAQALPSQPPMSQVTVTPSDAATVAPAEPAPLQEITVSAPEPRYVAPTQRDRIGRIWAPVFLDGQGPFRLVLDTGANRSAVIPRVTEALGWRARAARPLRVRGVTGTAVVPAIRVGRMEIGDLLLAPVTLPVVPDVFGGADGVLGNEGLGDKRIVIDFRRDSISVRRSRREPPGPGFHTLPITFARDHLLVIEVYVGNVRTKAIIDTGAPDSLGNLALLEALKRRVGTSSETDIQGVTLDIERGNRVRMPTIRMQGVMVRGAAMTVGDVQIFQHWNMTSAPALLLGMDVLGVLDRIIIDYRTRELHLLPRGS